MKQKSFANASNESVTQRIAGLGATHGYRFESDVVHLNTMFTVLDAKAHERTWALQLWACPTAPESASTINGYLVAETILPPIGELADDTHSFETCAAAVPPAGQGEYVMVLVLAAERAGKFNEIHDFAVYPNRERFLQPCMKGNIGYRIENDRVILEVERLQNPRDAANLSGTLALELWALAESYRGGDFRGVPLAGVTFDAVQGQCEYAQLSFDLPFNQPPAGIWNVSLMLREWTPSGYVTRDFTNFGVPMTIAPTPVQEKAPKAAPAKSAKAAKPSEPETISVNRASRDELATVKGLPTKVAEGIVSKRPFKSLDDLVNVKGMGAKLLAKVRSRLRL